MTTLILLAAAAVGLVGGTYADVLLHTPSPQIDDYRTLLSVARTIGAVTFIIGVSVAAIKYEKKPRA